MPKIEITRIISGKILFIINMLFSPMKIMGKYTSMGRPTNNSVGIKNLLKNAHPLIMDLNKLFLPINKKGIAYTKTAWINKAIIKFKNNKIGPSQICGFKNKSRV
ncbi:MAG: hypothetical protein KJ793_06015 [Candidatus Omnitrophica bacterium]|nr:hypothetical protein [Candidatus Omnitrophota bacterium]